MTPLRSGATNGASTSTRASAGGLKRADAACRRSREVWLLQRKRRRKRMGAGPGKTTGWAHRARAEAHAACRCWRASNTSHRRRGLHIRVDGAVRCLDVDSVIVCAGQESVRDAIVEGDARMHVIGGAHRAAELDAEAAIREAAELAARL